MPTIAFIAPEMRDFDDDAAFTQINLRILRNTAPVNFFDLCAISLPMMRPQAPPTGLMLVGRNGDDRALLGLAAGVEAALARG
jgi:aspartyl-tRNA(Asn)/glutamyl-tRNA(Gln) amidotransferase subunit A